MGESKVLGPGGSSLRVLIAEDSSRDVELVVSVLRRSGYHVTFEAVDSPAAFQEKLEQGEHELIISDYDLRDWTAIDALKIVKKSGKDIPVVVVSGSLGDETVVEVLKRGATDYILKDRMARLPSAVRRVLEEKALREEHHRQEHQITLQLARLTALRAIDITITSSLDLRVTLSVILHEVKTQLGVHAADILLLKSPTHILEYVTGFGFQSSPVPAPKNPWEGASQVAPCWSDGSSAIPTWKRPILIWRMRRFRRRNTLFRALPPLSSRKDK